MKTTRKAKRTILGTLTVLAVGLVGGASTLAWGPERATFTMENPATYATFNSITNNPLLGDERNFVRVGEIGAEVADLRDEVKVTPGKQYLVRIFWHNDASSIYNDEAHNRAGVAMGTTMSSTFTKLVTSKEKGTITGTIKASNTNPTAVWDEAYMTADEDVILKYVDGSAKIHSDWQASNSTMPTTLFSADGAPLGLNSLNGIIPGCDEYSGSVTYVLEAYSFKSDINKVVSKDGKNFTENAEMKAGEKVTFKISVNNSGTVPLKNLTVKDSLPAGLTFVPGSVKAWINDSSNVDSVSDAFFTNGYGLNQLGTGKTLNISYEATISADFKCKGTNLVNNATVTYSSEEGFGKSNSDTAKVTVLKEQCEDETKKPGFEIDKKISFDGNDWKDNLDAKPGDTAKFMITFKNTGQVVEKGVIAKDVMNPAAGLEYVPDTILITRSANGATARVEAGAEFFADGVLIGDVNPGEVITITYDVKFVADKFDCGTTTLYNNASVSGKIGDGTEITTVNDSVEIKVTRTENCEDTPPHTDCNDHPDAPECNLPNTGPVEIAMAIAITLGIAGGGYYFYRTKKSLKTIEGTATGKEAASTDKPAEPKADKK